MARTNCRTMHNSEGIWEQAGAWDSSWVEDCLPSPPSTSNRASFSCVSFSQVVLSGKIFWIAPTPFNCFGSREVLRTGVMVEAAFKVIFRAQLPCPNGIIISFLGVGGEVAWLDSLLFEVWKQLHLNLGWGKSLVCLQKETEEVRLK